MRELLRYGFAAAIVGGAGIGLGVIPDSDARSLSAFLGQPQQPSDYACFNNSGGATTNYCSTARRFCVTLPVETSTHTIEVTVRAPDANHNIACFGQSLTRDLFNTGFTGSRPPGIFGSSQVVVLGTLSVPNAGVLYVCCDIAPTASLQSIQY